MNKEAIELLVSREPRLKNAREELESMVTGAIVVHRSWGVGEIKDYDEQNNRLVIEFENQDELRSMDPAFCVGRLEILEADSLLARYRKDPAPIEEMVKKHPVDLVVEILQSCDEHSATNSEIERHLVRLLGMNRAKKWWTATKRLLVKDPRIAVPKRKTDPYVLRDEPVRAEDEILEDFFSTKAPKKKIALAEKLIALSVKHDDIKDALPDILKTLASSLEETKQLNPGERLHGIWIRNDLARFIHEDPEQLTPTSASILNESVDLSQLAEQIPSSHYKRYLSLIERTFPDRVEKIVFDLLKSSSGKLTTECINFLWDKDLSTDLADTLSRWLTEMSLKAPVLVWVIKNRHSRKFSRMIDPMVGPKLLNAVLSAVDYEALQNASTRRIPLAELLNDEADLVSELLLEADVETATDLATTLMLNQGFDDLSKKSLLARFIKQFPSIQSLVDGDSGPRQKALIVSRWSYDDRKNEYDLLINEKIPNNKIAIAVAREHGDLRENADYKMARQEQDTLLARKSELEKDLGRAQITDFKNAPTDVVGIGSRVELLQGSTGESVTYSILGAWDSDPESNVLSYQTPLGHALITRKAGETVDIEVDGHNESWTIQSIGRWIDASTPNP